MGVVAGARHGIGIGLGPDQRLDLRQLGGQPVARIGAGKQAGAAFADLGREADLFGVLVDSQHRAVLDREPVVAADVVDQQDQPLGRAAVGARRLARRERRRRQAPKAEHEQTEIEIGFQFHNGSVTDPRREGQAAGTASSSATIAAAAATTSGAVRIGRPTTR
jgi:hypothetical protein